MLDALQQYFPAGCSWSKPEGGMFVWVTLPGHIDAGALLNEAVEQEKVAFVPGAPFFANTAEHNTLRLSFVTVPPEQIRAGMERLGKLIASKL
jgi:2-aminoadipate transaminase